MLATEKKAREQTENALFRMLEDISNKLSTEIKVTKFFNIEKKLIDPSYRLNKHKEQKLKS